MPNKMLIDASHPEETRVVVVRGNRIEEFDFESQDKKQLKGNIYLARVTRVEPSLQAAFVEYGGNRHGFLAFSEIHPDYYQIPVADRQALLRAEAEAAEAEDDEDGDADERGDRSRGRRRRRSGKHRGRDERRPAANAAEASEIADDDASQVHGDHHDYGEEGGSADREALVAEHGASDGEENEHAESEGDESASDDRRQRDLEDGDSSAADTENTEHATERSDEPTSSIAASIEGDVISEPIAEATVTENDRGGVVEEVHSIHADDHEVESVGAEDALEEIRSRRKPVRRNYKIQEVIKRRQILLVQVVKEERGNKGAALTTYLSLAGRYSRADAEHGARRRHFPQDHQRPGPQAAEGSRAGSRHAAGHGRHPAHGRREPHQGRDQARLRISDAAVGNRPRPDADSRPPLPSSMRKAA